MTSLINHSRPVLYLAATGHGFGHAVRISTVAAAIQKLNPEILLIFATTAPRWLLESYIPGDFIYRPRAFDVGVIQSDSFQMDKPATLEKMQEIYKKRNALIAGEINFIKTNKVNLILADIPPLMAPIAKLAGIPCWMMSNFGWDFIYEAWGEEFDDIVNWIKDCYQQCDRLFRLPMAEPMNAFNSIIDVGLTGGTPHYSSEELRTKFKIIAAQDKTILLTFGGLGLDQIPYQNLARFSDWQFITFDRQAPDLPNIIKISEPLLRPVDFMPICSKVISKPGFSTFSETMRLDVPIVSLTRDDFAEAHLLLEGIENYADHQIIDTETFYQGNWEFLNKSPHPPKIGKILRKDGAEMIAQAVVDFFEDCRKNLSSDL
ncbi:glycosyl transferase [Crocosphaera sp. XPORK-15E]|uniref:glycosyl transferase n=1 Tax=Crocosphaera sp. XPORK-15E TaxID=3110247 RepID=UPI002B1E9692|nr:glycosyl transferase [Crocosphaera sp. XPORK-15E]MEA5533986.1 glycosyl transferase [Crocosphaera sp. XPORK-15E]